MDIHRHMVQSRAVCHVKAPLTLITFPTIGTEQARAAVAEKFDHPDAPLTSRDVILANGCSGALDLAINALCSEGQNMLIPRPGFSLYDNLAVSRFIEPRFYNLVVSVT